MRLLPRLADEDELDHIETRTLVAEERPSPVPIRWLGATVATALVARLSYLFFFTDPENAGDGFTSSIRNSATMSSHGTISRSPRGAQPSSIR